MDSMGWFAALISGILAGLSYPTRFGDWQFPDLGFLAFVCWIPLFQAVSGSSPRRAFALSFVAGLFHYAASQYWLYTAVHNFGGLSPMTSVFVMGLLFLVLAAYFAVIFWGSQWVCRRLALPPILIRPFFWVGVEYLRHYGPMGGYPWSQMAYTQGGFLSFMQSADLWGAYGLTFLVVLVNEAISLCLTSFRSTERKPVLRYLFPAIFLLAANLGYGIYRMRQAPPKPLAELAVGVVQGNIPQEEKWQRGRAKRILQIFSEGTAQLEAQGAELILWPEASLPFSVSYDAEKFPMKIGNHAADVLLGAITHSQVSQKNWREQPVYNSALLLSPDGGILDYYHKKELVPFGEYVPYQELLFFAKKMVAEVGNLKPGESFHPIRYRNYRLGILICYEDIFPYISREMVARGAHVLINITNDAWYGRSSAAYQHQVYSQFRSVETRRSLIRATNTGISSLIDRYGRILWQGEIFTRENFLTNLQLFDDGTFYVRMGDKLPQLSLIIMALLVLIAGFRPARPAGGKARS
jgi:apolipoprotein N-acyltransferase